MLLVAVTLIVVLFQLPRVVVDNDAELETVQASSGGEPQPVDNTPHNTLTDPVVIEKIDSVKALWKAEDFSENNSIFANYLANQYLAISRYDSAIMYFEWLNENFPERENKLQLAEAYFQAFGFAMDQTSRTKYSEKARELLQGLLDENPGDLGVKNMLAMTYMSGSTPMQGIMMLREIVEEDPDNEEALLNLGILAIQTGQFDRAEEHLGKLVEFYPEHWQGHLLLGAAKLEHGHLEEARSHFEMVKERGDDPALVEAAENYLENI